MRGPCRSRSPVILPALADHVTPDEPLRTSAESCTPLPASSTSGAPETSTDVGALATVRPTAARGGLCGYGLDGSRAMYSNESGPV